MPGGDRTGPRGFGPRTGRRAGFCAGYDAPGYANPAPGYGGWHARGYGGWGRGGGHGWRHRFYAAGRPGWDWAGYGPARPEEEIAALKEDAEWLKDQLEAINRRIEDLSEK